MRQIYRVRQRRLFGRTVFSVQVRSWFGIWVDVKIFCDPDNPEFSRFEAEELMETLRIG